MVVHITAFPSEKPVPRLKEIVVPNIFLTLAKEDREEGFAALRSIASQGNSGVSAFFLNLVFNFNKLFFEEENILEFLSDPKEKFDVVIIEWFFSDFISGIAPLFQCPLIWVGPTEAHWQVLKLVDGISNPAHNADLLCTPPLSFWERMLELCTIVKRTVMISFLVTPKEKSVYDSVFSKLAAQRGVQMPAYEEAVYNGSLLLLNSHPSYGTPFNLPQNAVYWRDLQKLMDNAKHGVIYFSMGSNLKSADMSTEMRDPLLQMFAKLKQTIIWKFEGELDNVPSNIHLVKWAPQQSIFCSGDGSFDIAWVMENPNQMNDIGYLQDIAYIIANETFQNKNFLKILEDPNEGFDLVVSELYETELYAALAPLYKCPLVWSYSMGAHWMALRLISEATSPTYAADYLSAEIPPFDFYGRLNKLWLQIQWNYIKWSTTKPKEKAAYEKLLKPLFEKRGLTPPNYQDVIYNGSLILANDYKGNGLMPSTPQNFQFIGGYHVDTPPKPLPNDIQTILDNAKHGFIYFSMGSLWQSKDIPTVVTNGLLKVFSELKETVIWKYEDTLPNLPKNVHILKWAPQPSILAHPKCLFFITHGGHLSSIETIHFGVPTIGVPVFFDQFININKAVSIGYALKVDLTYNLHNDLKTAIATMLSNSTFREKAKELSQIYHDRVAPPGKELVHWVEHVVKTGGALHLRSPALLVPWYQKVYLDLVAIVASILVIVYIVFKRLFTSRKVDMKKKRN